MATERNVKDDRARRWRWLRRALTALFLGLVGWLVVSRALAIDWTRVGQSLREMRPLALCSAAALATASYAIYACFDWFARIYTKQVPKLRQFEIAWVSYAFNLNLGSLIGSVGFRYRLYARSGVEPQAIARIVATSMITNWSGYFLLGGLVFAARAVDLPPRWEIGAVGLQLVGIGMLLLLAGYLVLCARRHERPWRWRQHEVVLPSPRRALAQIGASSLNWLAIAATIWVLLPEHVGFAAVLTVFLLSSVAGAMAHVPGGLGVLEAVFLALLGDEVPEHDLIAGLLAFRAFYYLIPLALALALYVWIEIRGRRGGARRPAKRRRPVSARAARREALSGGNP
ncbi:lysylphosphatidylglycerol synthase domain-containing protein [Solimonas soli]|uniref:lysylphosphatidylglycerol synthase domain-containing protein n=1 Tax=Solimonas soli TaxID=413479 RepID=UPI0004AE3EF7|nr:lysylphosphatidylglycerol synthase domain-containing protein [Solimonas soli]